MSEKQTGSAIAVAHSGSRSAASPGPDVRPERDNVMRTPHKTRGQARFAYAERFGASEPNPGQPVQSEHPLPVANVVLEWSPALVPLLQAAVGKPSGTWVSRGGR